MSVRSVVRYEEQGLPAVRTSAAAIAAYDAAEAVADDAEEPRVEVSHEREVLIRKITASLDDLPIEVLTQMFVTAKREQTRALIMADPELARSVLAGADGGDEGRASNVGVVNRTAPFAVGSSVAVDLPEDSQ